MARISAIASTVAKQLKLISPTSDGGESLLTGEDLTRFSDDPVGFIRYLEPDAIITNDQILIMESVRDDRQTSVAAAHGVGKTWIAAWILLWYVYAVRGKVISTAPVREQVKELLWSYIRKLYDKHSVKLGGRRIELAIYLTEDAKAIGFTVQSYNENSFQGRHSVRLLIIFDESNGISQVVDEGASSCLTGDQNRMLRIGNPTTTGTPFWKACRNGHIRIPVWTHPNVSWAYFENDDGMHRLKPEIDARIRRSTDHPKYRKEPIKPQKEWDDDLPRDQVDGAVSVGWIEEIRLDRLENSPYWMGRVEGIFPETTGSAILPMSWFKLARDRYDINPEWWETYAIRGQPWSFGVDVGDGGDPHSIVGFHGKVLKICRVIPGLGDRMDTIRIAKIVAYEYLAVYGGTVGIDRIGVGAGTLGWLLDNGYDAWGASFGSSAVSKNDEEIKDTQGTFLDWKTEAFWGLREFLAARFDDELSAIAPLGDFEDSLMEDLNGIYYEEKHRGTCIEDKSVTRKRLGRSPNAGDAAAIAFAGISKTDNLLWRSAYS